MFLTVPSLKVDMNIIFRPFARNVWYMILILTVIIIFGLWIILKLEKNDSAYGSTILIIIAALCQQGFYVNKQFMMNCIKYSYLLHYLNYLVICIKF